jgi:hypothetical protein
VPTAHLISNYVPLSVLSVLGSGPGESVAPAPAHLSVLSGRLVCAYTSDGAGAQPMSVVSVPVAGVALSAISGPDSALTDSVSMTETPHLSRQDV